jgi:hypothetical protein
LLTAFLRRALPVAVAVTFAAPLSLGCAAASTASAPAAPRVAAAVTPGWRVVQFMPRAVVGGLSASGPRDAWLAGEVCGADSLCDHVFVRHWDGTAWRTVAVPKAVGDIVGEGAGVTAVAASSPSSAWVFDQRGPSVDHATVLHWSVNHWAPSARLAAAIDAAVAPSASDAWAFGAPAGDERGGYIAHFDGKSWQHAEFPVQVQSASALSAGDIWAGGNASDGPDGSVVIEHWDGKAWRTVPVPSLGIPPTAWTGVFVSAVAPADAWANVSVLAHGTRYDILLHWNGRAWARVAFSCGGSMVSAEAPDGQRGLWLASTAAPSGQEWFCHGAQGDWAKTVVPKRAGQQPSIDQLAWIPGTRSLWATGGFDADAGEVILKYGP